MYFLDYKKMKSTKDVKIEAHFEKYNTVDVS